MRPTAVCRYRRQVPGANRGSGAESLNALLPHNCTTEILCF